MHLHIHTHIQKHGASPSGAVGGGAVRSQVGDGVRAFDAGVSHRAADGRLQLRKPVRAGLQRLAAPGRGRG